MGWYRRRILETAIRLGVPARIFGLVPFAHETLTEHLKRKSEEGRKTGEVIHPQEVANNPLPVTAASPADLPDDRGWWGYSFRDVPSRTSTPTILADLPDATVCWYFHPEKPADFYPAIVSDDLRSVNLREIRFRPGHAEVLRQSGEPARIEHGVWFAERVYDNHSHWLTAHLPKLLLIRELGLLDRLLLPPKRSKVMDESLAMLGIDASSLPTFSLDRPLHAERLTVIETDRFRPDLLRRVPAAFGTPPRPAKGRRIFVSRAAAARRKLIDEESYYPLLARHDIEPVRLEDLTFREQVALMQDTELVVAPHGAGMTNMMFCPPGAKILEIADPSFPNPNFYAVAAAMGHSYGLVPARSSGEGHELEKNLETTTEALQRGLAALLD